ncbi:hypothetical protein [Scytonema sp. NUACC21]
MGQYGCVGFGCSTQPTWMVLGFVGGWCWVSFLKRHIAQRGKPPHASGSPTYGTVLDYGWEL